MHAKKRQRLCAWFFYDRLEEGKIIELKSVIKRDGSTVPYNRDKIVIAIQKANAEVEPEERVTDEQIDGIVRLIEKRKCKRMLVEDIQDIIETELMGIEKNILANT